MRRVIASMLSALALSVVLVGVVPAPAQASAQVSAQVSTQASADAVWFRIGTYTSLFACHIDGVVYERAGYTYKCHRNITADRPWTLLVR